MSSHGIKFLDLRDFRHDDKLDRLEEEIKLLNDEDSLVVILSFNPTPYFEQITDSPDFEDGDFCFNNFQVNPRVCIGSITPTTESPETDRPPVTSDTYSSIFAGLPMNTG